MGDEVTNVLNRIMEFCYFVVLICCILSWFIYDIALLFGRFYYVLDSSVFITDVVMTIFVGLIFKHRSETND